MTTAFQRLPVAAACRLVEGYTGSAPGAITPDLAYTPRMIGAFSDAFTMLRACLHGDIEAVKALLEMGLDLEEVRDSNRPTEPVSPLIWAVQGADTNDRAKGLALVDFLLSKGASPNRIVSHKPQSVCASPMHAACILPDVLDRLIAHGGDVRLSTDQRWGVLDHWLWSSHCLDKKKRPDALRALDVLIAAGIDPNAQLYSGGNFLVHCWASSSLRPHIPELIAKGFDPHKPGQGQGVAGASLVDHLAKKTKTGKGGELAHQLMAEFTAQVMEGSTAAAASPASRPRL